MKKYNLLGNSVKKKNNIVSKNGDILFRASSINLKNQKGRKISSSRWLSRHINDPFVQAAQIDGYFSRAAYKLMEIDEKFLILKNLNIKNKNPFVLDLGCSPGSWTQYICNLIDKDRNKSLSCIKIIGIDLVQPKFIFDNNKNFFINGDFTSLDVQTKVKEIVKSDNINLVISDIAPNLSGDNESDRFKMEAVIDSILDFIKTELSVGGSLVFKSILGAENNCYKFISKNFKQVTRFKPKSSRKESSEIYIIAKNYYGRP
jgi:23S rRNA (uridine2552-2'-O)-methyltransferase